jgi:hypothetical protein
VYEEVSVGNGKMEWEKGEKNENKLVLLHTLIHFINKLEMIFISHIEKKFTRRFKQI